jgi:hypothetical protein
MIISKEQYINIFFVFFLLRGFLQVIYNTGFLIKAEILHIFSLTLLFLLFLNFLNNVVGYKKHELLVIHLLFFLIYMISISLINGNAITTDIISYFISILSFMLFIYCYDNKNSKFLYFIIISIFIIQLLYSIYQSGYGIITEREGRNTLGSIFGHANSFALILTAYFIAKFNKEGFKNNRNFDVIIFILLFFLILILGSRSMIIGLISSFIFWKLVGFKVNRFTVVGYMILLSLLTYFIVDYGIRLLDTSWGEQTFTSGNSLKWRIIHWYYYLQDMDTISATLFGNGVGAHEDVTLIIYGRFFEVHNDFIKIIYDMGVLGLVFYLVIDLFIINYIKKICGLDWRLISIFGMKYFFMFFDNFATNIIPVISLSFVTYLFVMDRSRSE